MAESRTMDKFAVDALKVFEVAAKEAGGAGTVGTHHILLGLLADESLPSAKALTKGPLNFDRAREAAGAGFAAAETPAGDGAKLPGTDQLLTGEAHALISRAAFDASERGLEVDSLRLAAALFESADCDAARLITAVGANVAALKAVFLREHPITVAPTASPAEMHKRPSRRAQQVLDEAIARAKSNGIGHYDSGYALLGLCTVRGGIASAVLAEHDVTPDNVRALIAELTPSSYRTADDIVQETLPPSPEMNKCLSSASRYATLTSSEHMETEHLLLAAVEAGTRAAELLDRMGFDRDSIASDLRMAMNLGL
jgi:ATP-dependent Clp protease ATP-binding subunit ClpA